MIMEHYPYLAPAYPCAPPLAAHRQPRRDCGANHEARNVLDTCRLPRGLADLRCLEGLHRSALNRIGLTAVTVCRPFENPRFRAALGRGLQQPASAAEHEVRVQLVHASAVSQGCSPGLLGRAGASRHNEPCIGVWNSLCQSTGLTLTQQVTIFCGYVKAVYACILRLFGV